jgi:hypothetical protein
VLAGDGEHAVLFGPAPDGAGLAAWTISDDLSWKRLGFTGTPPRTYCGEEACVRLQQAWVVATGVVVLGTPGPVNPQTIWFAQAQP